MTYNEYKKALSTNMLLMSRTLNEVLDLSSVADKAEHLTVKDGADAQKRALANLEAAFDYIYNNRTAVFDSKDDLSRFILELAGIVNNGIVKDGSLFRTGSDDTKYNYAPVSDLEYLWDWFSKRLFTQLCNNQVSAADNAALAEYYINTAAHFFADGCGKISMLVSSFLLMRDDCDLPVYRGRDEYFKYAGLPCRISRNNPIDEKHFARFLEYFRSLFTKAEPQLLTEYDQTENSLPVLLLTGILCKNTLPEFSDKLDTFFSVHPQEVLNIDCTGLKLIYKTGTDFLKQTLERGRRFKMLNLNQDCYVALLLSGLGQCAEDYTGIPEIDASRYPVLGQGSNGIVYALNDEVILKTFKTLPDIDSILKERNVTKDAFCMGINCPISFGYAMVDSKPALLFEFEHGTSLFKHFKNDRSNIKKFIKPYVELIKRTHGSIGDSSKAFPRNTMLNELCQKADLLDAYLDDSRKGKLRKIIETIDYPDVLIHGDPQPRNIHISENGAGFIDLETMCTGPDVLDLGALRRSLLSEKECLGRDRCVFLDVPSEMLNEVWEEFIKEYFIGEDESVIRKKLSYSKIISCILAVSKFIKKKLSQDEIDKAVSSLKKCIDEWYAENPETPA